MVRHIDFEMSYYIYGIKSPDRDIGNYNQKYVYNDSENERMFLFQREMFRRNNFYNKVLTGNSLVGFDRASQFEEREELVSRQKYGLGSSGQKSLKVNANHYRIKYKIWNISFKIVNCINSLIPIVFSNL
jgi:hypothetical protein